MVLAATPPRPAPDSAAFRLSLQVDRRVGFGFNAKHFDLQLAAGRQLAGDGSTGVSLATQLRLGARDGVNLTAQYGFLLARDPVSGGPRADPLGPHGTISIPLGPRLALTAEGSFLGDAAALATLGLTHRVAGDGGPGSWYLSGGLGFAFQRTGPDCGSAPLCIGSQWSAAPAAMFGIERRF